MGDDQKPPPMLSAELAERWTAVAAGEDSDREELAAELAEFEKDLPSEIRLELRVQASALFMSLGAGDIARAMEEFGSGPTGGG